MAASVKWLCLAIAVLCFNLPAQAQKDTFYNPDHLFQPQELHADLAFLKGVLEEAHPSLYRYTPKDTLEARFAAADAQLDKPMTELDFWKIADRYVAAIRSGHTVIDLSVNNINWHNQHPFERLPLNVYIINNHLFAHGAPKEAGDIFEGAEITAIDGHPATEVLAALRQLVSPEGYSMQFVNSELETVYFRQLYGYMYGFKPDYDVAFVDSSGAIKHVTLKAIKSPHMYSIDQNQGLLEGEKSELAKSVEVSYFKDIPSTVLLKIKHLTYLNDAARFDAGFFKRLHDEKIKNLIIDMRGNGGGYEEIGWDMLHYLVSNFVVPADALTAPTNKYSFANYIIYPGSDTVHFNHLVKTGKHEYADIRGTGVNLPSSYYAFNKNVYVLIDKSTFSAASLFVASLRSQRNITVIGEESGGGEAGTDGGGFSIVRLPNTGLMLRLPQFWMSITTRNKNTGHGIIPDITIAPTIANRIVKRDVVLNNTLQMIVRVDGK